MRGLDEYIIKDSETQYDKNYGYFYDCLYEIYGVKESGVLFERDLIDTDRVLVHISNGVKVIQYGINKEDCFFRKDNNGFFKSYKNCDDYNYSKEPKMLSKDEMINTLKEFVYLRNPHIGSMTMMGWGNKDGDNSPINDPNWCYNLIQLDDKKEYTIIKRRDTVKLFEGDVNKFYFDDHDELAVLRFTLERDLYEKAIKLNSLRRTIATNMFGKVNASLLKEFIELESEISNSIRKE